MNSMHAVSGSSLNGHLRLRCETRADGTPYLSRQSFCAPIHIGKALLDDGRLLLNLANPTAGFFDGDRVTSDVAVAGGARLVLSTPAAARVYQTRSGKAAANCQHFQLEEHAGLEWIPEAFIPHAGASYVQTTRIDLETSSSLLFFEWLAPGRVAAGEVFAYRNLRWELNLCVAGQLIARERYNLRPDDPSLEALRRHFPAAHYLSAYAAGEMTRQWPAAQLDALTDDDVLLGHGPLQRGVHVIRALCRDSLSARALLGRLRCLLYAGANQLAPGLGRL